MVAIDDPTSILRCTNKVYLADLLQTHKVEKSIPMVIYGTDYWKRIVNFDALVKMGTISKKDLQIFRFCDDVDSAFEYLTGELTKTYLRGKINTQLPFSSGTRPMNSSSKKD